MVKMIKKAIILLFYSFVCILLFSYFSNTVSPLEPKKPSAVELEQIISEAWERGDTTQIAELVRENRWAAREGAEKMLDSYVALEADGKTEEASDKHELAFKMAVSIEGIFADSFVVKEAEQFESWSGENKKKKKKEDILAQEAKLAYRKND